MAGSQVLIGRPRINNDNPHIDEEVRGLTKEVPPCQTLSENDTSRRLTPVIDAGHVSPTKMIARKQQWRFPKIGVLKNHITM